MMFFKTFITCILLVCTVTCSTNAKTLNDKNTQPSLRRRNLQQQCDLTKVTITELADSFDNDDGQLIELTFLDKNCKNKVISVEDGMWLHWNEPIISPNQEMNIVAWTDLAGAPINKNGFLVLSPCHGPHDKNCYEEPTGSIPSSRCEVLEKCMGDPGECEVLCTFCK